MTAEHLPKALTFECEGETLVAVLRAGTVDARTGVLIIVGGPQYRIGSHRQFYDLANELSLSGIPSFRFDVRGMGDSSGDLHEFDQIQPDIQCAIDTFFAHQPQLEKVVLWGLCDAASAALFYAAKDPRISGLVLLNPWVRTEEGEAKAYLKHYYRERLMQKEFWLKLIGGGINPATTLRSLIDMIKRASTSSGATSEISAEKAGVEQTTGSLPERMIQGLTAFNGRVLFILSGDDLTAQEFSDLIIQDNAWKTAVNQSTVEIMRLEHANHTFSRQAWKSTVNKWTIDWINSLNVSPSS